MTQGLAAGGDTDASGIPGGPGDSAEAPGAPPDAHEEERAPRGPLALLTAISAINVSHQFLLAATFPLIKVEFGLSDSALGVLGSAYLVLAAVFAIPFAVLADRYTRTRIIGWGTFIWGTSTIISGGATGYGQLLFGRVLLGVSDPADNPTSYSLLTDYYPVAQRGKIFGIYNIGQLFGLLALPVAGLIAEIYGWRAAFYVWAIPGFVLALFAFRMTEPERGAADRAYQDIEEEERPSIYDRISALRGYLAVVRVPTFDVTLLTQALTTFFTRGMGVWLAVFFVRYHDMSLASASGTVALLGLGALVGSLAGGYLGDALVRRGYRTGRVALAGATITASSVLFVPTFITDATGLMLITFVLAALLIFPGQPLINAVTANVIHPKLRGRSSSTDWFVQTLAGALGVLTFGVLADSVGLRASFLYVVPFVAIAGLALLLLGPRFLPRDEDRMRRVLAIESGELEPDEEFRRLAEQAAPA